MIRVAFCCHGNICRSTLSESVFTHKVNALGLGDQFIIDSFATSREEIGNHPHRGTVNKLREVGMDMSKDLLDELKDLEKKCRSVNQRMKKDIARNS